MSTNNQWSLDCKRMVRHSCYTMQHTLSMEQNEGTSVYWSDETASGHAVNSCGEGKQIGDAHSGTCSVCVCYAVLCLVTQLYLTLCNPMDCNPQAPLSMGILQARILGWVAMPSSRGSSQPWDQTQVSHIAGKFFTIWATKETPCMCVCFKYREMCLKGTRRHWKLTPVVGPGSRECGSMWLPV